ncbi:hypothetical protein [Pelotomaculum propionicicum]|uniref:Uncharacterized protein n=1 Tax=Pelotomaculum propionicicum TaxID=258475 RepID=A0A4Y7RKZ8_9FIRM|nr:hypothetical protein [Pelotomaculum propionicicum]TEB09362.1 hypothetical protein Pmgp_03183 [Pelotomaculum propionicicum]
MGSAGSGKFGTYRIGKGEGTSGTGSGVGRMGSEGSGEVECPKIIENIPLEDVAVLEYYQKYNTLPSQETSVRLRATIYRGRLVVETADLGEILGNLPTQYNTLINCIKKGMKYSGTIVASGITPVPFVVVTLNA